MKRIIKISVSAALIGYLIYLVDFDATLRRIGSIDLTYIWIAAILLLAQSALSSLKWRLLLGARQVYLGFFFLFTTYLKGNFFSLFLPTSFGGDVYRVVRLNKESGNLGDSASSVLFDRLTGLFALVTIAVIAYLFLPQMPYKPILFPLYVLGIAIFLLVTSAGFIRRLEGLTPPRFSKALLPLEAFRDYRRMPGVLCAVLAIAFLFQFNIVVVNKVFCIALGIDIPFSLLLAIIPLIYLTEVLPISINGIGVRDSAFVFFFSYLGHSAEEGLALALLVLLFRYLIGSIGGLILLVESFSPGSPKSRAPE